MTVIRFPIERCRQPEPPEVTLWLTPMRYWHAMLGVKTDDRFDYYRAQRRHGVRLRSGKPICG